MPIRPIAESRQSDDRSYQQENHDELRIFNDESRHDSTLIDPADQLFRFSRGQ
jgi:hypothetical protein